MKPLATVILPASALVSLTLAMSGGCASRGPAERAGRGIDRGVQGAKDIVTPPGPAEKAGRAVQRAIDP